MKTKLLLFNLSYWDSVYDAFEDYCYNFFDDTISPEYTSSNNIYPFLKLVFFIVFALVLHYQLIFIKPDIGTLENRSNHDKRLWWEEKIENIVSATPFTKNGINTEKPASIGLFRTSQEQKQCTMDLQYMENVCSRKLMYKQKCEFLN